MACESPRSIGSVDTVEEGYYSQFTDSFASVPDTTSSTSMLQTHLLSAISDHANCFQTGRILTSDSQGNGFKLYDHAGVDGSKTFTKLVDVQYDPDDSLNGYVNSSEIDRHDILLNRLRDAHVTIDQLLSRISLCSNDISDLRKEKEAFEKAYRALKVEVEELRRSHCLQDGLLGRVNMLSSEVLSLTHAHENLHKRHLSQTEDMSALSMRYNSLVAELEKAKEQNASLDKELTATDGELKETKMSFNESEVQKNELKSQIEVSNNECDRLKYLVQDYEAKICEMKVENDRQEKVLCLKSEEIMLSSTQIDALQEKVVFLENEASCIKSSNDEISEKLKLQINQLQSSLGNSEKQCEQSRLALLDLQESKTHLEDSAAKAEGKVVELQLKIKYLEAQILDGNQRHEKTCEDLQQKSENVVSLQSVVDSHRVKLHDATKENVELKAELSMLRERCTYRENALSVERDKLCDELKLLKLKFAKKRKDCDRLLNKKLADAEETLKSVKYALECEQKENMILKERIVKMQENEKTIQSTYEETLSSKDTNVKELILSNSELKRKVRDISHEMTHMKSELDASNVNCKEVHMSLEISEAHGSELSDLLEKSNLKVTDLESQNHLLKAEVADQLKIIQNLNDDQQKVATSHSDLVKKFRNEVRKLKSNLSRQKQELETLRNGQDQTLIEADRSILQLKEEHGLECAKLVDQLGDSMKKLEKQIEENEMLIAKTSHLEAEVSEHKNKFNSIQDEVSKIPTLIMENKNLKESLEKQTCELKRMVEERNSMFYEQKESSTHTADLLGKLNTLLENMDKEHLEHARVRSEAHAREKTLTQELRMLSESYDNLKTQQKHHFDAEMKSLQKEVKSYEAENSNLQTELKVLRDLNSKLEGRNSQLESEKKDLILQVEQVQNDIVVLKDTFEQLLNDQLLKQKAEFLEREGELLSKSQHS